MLPLGAVLAGRVLGEQMAGLAIQRGERPGRRRSLAVLAAGYLAALGYGAAQPAVPPPTSRWPAGWWRTGSADGLANYWQANSTTGTAAAGSRSAR